MAFRLIGMAIGDQRFDQRDHLGDMAGGARLDVRRQAAERGNVLMILFGRGFGHPDDGIAYRNVRIVAHGPRIYLVVDICDVAGIGDVIRPIDMAQQPVQHIKDDCRACVADMGEVVDRRTTDIHAHFFRIDRDKHLLRPRQRVVELQIR